MPIIVKAQAVIPKEPKEKIRAEIPVERQEFPWMKLGEGFIITLPGGNFCKLSPFDKEWEFKARFGNLETVGRRKTLELAYQQVDKLIYNWEKSVWYKTRCHDVLERIQDEDDIFAEDYDAFGAQSTQSDTPPNTDTSGVEIKPNPERDSELLWD